ncbi:MAG: alpha-amylase family glycosyl hydrolase [Lysinibacillus sp.]
MRLNKWISSTMAALLLASTIAVAPGYAEEKRTIVDESIYDVLVDRFFNGAGSNDEGVDTQDNTKFNGGDFVGLTSKADFIATLGHTIVSVGSVFPTERYDGGLVTSYEGLEPHFGTEEEFVAMIDTYNKKNIGIMMDFPLSNVSANHEWATTADKAKWVKSIENGFAQFDLKNTDVQKALKEQVVKLVETYDVSGIRLTNIEDADTAFLNEVITSIKAVKDIYVISNAESDADFDARVVSEMPQLFADSFKNVDLSAEALIETVNTDEPTLIQFDTLWTNRITAEVMSDTGNHYPPNRLPLIYATSLLLPGVPATTYGSEIGMNGVAGPEAHQLYNFKTDEELIKKIENIHTLRNSSPTLRNGDFEVLKNEDGFLVFKRESEDETWLVVVNNTSKTDRIEIPSEQLGVDKVITGLFEAETIRTNRDGNYAIILDREMFEVYQVKDDRGLNKSYIIALSLVYIAFTAFVIMIVKRGRKRRAEDAAK